MSRAWAGNALTKGASRGSSKGAPLLHAAGAGAMAARPAKYITRLATINTIKAHSYQHIYYCNYYYNTRNGGVHLLRTCFQKCVPHPLVGYTC